MAERRMMSKKIVDSDAFMDMPLSAQSLYFHLLMRADDDGFVGNPRKIMRMINANDDDYKLIMAKRFVLVFESGVCVIKHWLIHNYIQNDRYSPSQYIEEKNTLIVKENKSYTECIQNVSTTDTQYRLGKVSIGKDSKDKNNNTDSQSSSEENIFVSELINSFKPVNPSYQVLFSRKNQRDACKRLIEKHGVEFLQKITGVLERTNGTPYFPSITTPLQLEEKIGNLMAALQKQKSKNNNGIDLNMV